MTNDRFRDSIDFYFGDLDIKSKKQLEILMRHRKFFNAINPEKRKKQTQLLLDDAWKYLTGKTTLDKTYIVIKGRKGFQIRNVKTGRIMGWAYEI